MLLLSPLPVGLVVGLIILLRLWSRLLLVLLCSISDKPRGLLGLGAIVISSLYSKIMRSISLNTSTTISSI
ncbi:hypothetical protein ES703_21247 [subsurface metagenome]